MAESCADGRDCLDSVSSIITTVYFSTSMGEVDVIEPSEKSTNKRKTAMAFKKLLIFKLILRRV